MESPSNDAAWITRKTRGLDTWYFGPDLDDYRPTSIITATVLYVIDMQFYLVLALLDLYSHHCLLPKFTPEQHAIEVHDKLVDAIQGVPKAAKRKLLRTVTTAIKKMATTPPSPPQRMEDLITLEGEGPLQSVAIASIVMISTNHTNPCILQTAPCIHKRA